jgi:hypothetical protein
MPFDSWIKRYNVNVERSNNDLLLMNMVRAGEHMPLMFTGVQVVRGSGQITNSIGIGNTSGNTVSAQVGTQAIFGWTNAVTPQASLAATDGFNFDVAILDTAEFYKGLLTPVVPQTFDFYLGQGIPPELLLNLLVERISITKDGETRTYVNDPGTPRYEAFRTTLTHMLELGLTTEPTVTDLPVGAPLTAAQASDMKDMVPAISAGLLPLPAPGGKFQMTKKVTAARFCFMAALPGLPELPQASLCKASPKHRAANARPTSTVAEGTNEEIEFEKASMSIQLRSTRSVFAYLGRHIIEQTEKGEAPVELVSPAVKEIAPAGTGLAIFRVVKDSGGDSLASVDYRGSSYSIPTREQGVSATVLSMVTQLMSLSKSVNAVPSTGTVVVAH